MQLQKAQLLEQRKQIQSQMRAEKEELMAKFESIQRTGKIPQELKDKIGADRIDSLNNTRNNDTTNKSPQHTVNASTKPVKSTTKPVKSTVSPTKNNETGGNLTEKKNEVIKANDN